jgi:hypothetical protein
MTKKNADRIVALYDVDPHLENQLHDLMPFVGENGRLAVFGDGDRWVAGVWRPLTDWTLRDDATPSKAVAALIGELYARAIAGRAESRR